MVDENENFSCGAKALDDDFEIAMESMFFLTH